MSRTMLARKVYVYSDGETGRSAKPNATTLRFEFLAPEKDENDKAIVLETREIDLVEFQASMSEMAYCAIGHGLSQKLGDNLAGIAGKAEKAGAVEDATRGFVDFAVSLWDDAWDNIAANVWVAEGEGSSGGSNVTILLEAIVAAFGDEGQEIDEAGMSKLRANLQDEEFRKKAKAREDIAMHVARITAERAAKRAQAAAEKAADADSGSLAELIA